MKKTPNQSRMFFAALLVAIVVALFVVLMPGIAKAQEQSQEAVGRLGGTLESALRAIRTVKASRAEQRQAERVLAAADDYPTAAAISFVLMVIITVATLIYARVLGTDDLV